MVGGNGRFEQSEQTLRISFNGTFKALKFMSDDNDVDKLLEECCLLHQYSVNYYNDILSKTLLPYLSLIPNLYIPGKV